MSLIPISSTKTYQIWNNLKKRCNQKHKFLDHGGRGISYDPSWEHFENFYLDMGECPEGLTLDRIDNDGNYSKDNCRWATYSEQNVNRRIRKDNTTGVKGVQHYKKGFLVTGVRNKIKHYLGYTTSFEKACTLRANWELSLND
jgi:hypothetical protein